MAQAATTQWLEYRVKSGDTLSLILLRFYDTGPRHADYERRLAQLMALNPHILHPDQIRAGSLLRLSTAPLPALSSPAPATSLAAGPRRTLPGTASDPKTAAPLWPAPAAGAWAETWAGTGPGAWAWPDPGLGGAAGPAPFLVEAVPATSELDYWSLAWLASQRDYALQPGAFLAGAGDNLLSGGNVELVRAVSDHYADFKAGRITKAQYDYRRRIALERFRRNIGPFERALFGDKTPQQVVRIARGGGLPATAHIERHAMRLRQLGSLGKHGGYVLTAVGVAASCVEIAHTESQDEKNRIFVDTAASTLVGVGSGVLVGLFLVSNPVGWGTALVLAAGSVAASYGAGKVARVAYDTMGNRVDLVGGSGIDRLCRTR